MLTAAIKIINDFPRRAPAIRVIRRRTGLTTGLIASTATTASAPTASASTLATFARLVATGTWLVGPFACIGEHAVCPSGVGRRFASRLKISFPGWTALRRSTRRCRITNRAGRFPCRRAVGFNAEIGCQAVPAATRRGTRTGAGGRLGRPLVRWLNNPRRLLSRPGGGAERFGQIGPWIFLCCHGKSLAEGDSMIPKARAGGQSRHFHGRGGRPISGRSCGSCCRCRPRRTGAGRGSPGFAATGGPDSKPR